MRRLLPLLAAALAACNTGFAPQYRVQDLRILDVQSADPSSVPSTAPGFAFADVVQPGDTLALAALVANPLGRPGLAVDWLACLPQPSEALSPCLDAAYLQDPSRLAAGVGILPGVVSLGSGVSVSYPVPATPDVLDALAFSIGLARQNSTFECRLYAEIVVVAVATAGGRREVATKQVPLLPPAGMVAAGGVNDRYVANLNPAVGDVRVNPADENACTGGATIEGATTFPSGEVVLCALATDGSSQAYGLCEPDGSTTAASEAMDWQWYATDGEFPDAGTGVGDARGSHVKFQRPAGAFTLWVVARDGRGGTAWSSFSYPAP